MSDLLQFVQFKDLINWSVLHLLNNKFDYNQKYELVKITDFLTRNKTQVNIKDKTKYKRVKIKQYNKGLFLRDVEAGERIGTKKQYLIKDGQFLLSKIDARNGAFGVVHKEIDKAIITGNFWTYNVDYKKINPFFLSLITTTKQFMQFCDMASSGTTNRHYLQEYRFLNMKIPLPPIKIQQQLFKNYQDKLNLAKQQETQTQQKEAEIESYLYEALGIELPKEKKQNNDILQFVWFKDLDRWDVAFLLNKNQITSVYGVIPIISIIDNFLKDKNNNSLRFDSKKYSDDKFKYIGMENIEKESGKLLTFQNVKGIDIKSQTIKLPKGFFLYGKLRPYLNKYFYNNFNDENIITSSEFFAFSVKNINEMYFKFCLSSSFIQHQITNHMKGARMPRIGEDVFKNLQIPLPPLKIQNKIASHIKNIKNEIQTLKQQAEQNQKLALNEFEAEIFNES